MLFLKQSTASQSVKLGPFVDSTDGVTAETGLTIANTDIKLSKAGGTMAAKNSGGGTHDADGWYTITLDATDTNTVGALQVSCKVAGACPVWAEFQVLEEAIYDALIAASASAFDSSAYVKGVSGTLNTLDALDTAQDSQHSSTQALVTTVDTVVDGIQTDLSNATDGLGAIKTAVDAIPTSNPTAAAIADAVWDEAQADHVSAGSFGETATEIASILADTNELQTNQGNWLTATGFSTHSAADVWAVATRVLTANTNLNDPTAAAIADAVWDEVLSAASHNVANSAGRRLRNLGSQVVEDGTAQAGATASITLAAGASAVDDYYNLDNVSIVDGTGAGQSRMIMAYNGTTKVASVYRDWSTTPDNTSQYVIQSKTEILVRNSGIAQAGASNSITLASTASAVNDNYIGESVVILAGTGASQVRVITAYNGTTKVASVTDAWATNPDNTSIYAVLPLGRAYVVDIDSDSLTKITNELDANSTKLLDILTDTAEIGAAGAGLTDLGGMSTAMKAEVNAEMVDVIATDTYAEPGSVPAATASLKDKIGWLAALARNKLTSTATTQTLRNDADSGSISTSTISDDGTTFTRGEWS